MAYSRRSISASVAVTATAAVGVLAPVPASASDLPQSPAVKLPSATYQVTGGDTIWDIAQRFGVSMSSIMSANNLGNNAVIYPGQRLEIPSSNSTP